MKQSAYNPVFFVCGFMFLLLVNSFPVLAAPKGKTSIKPKPGYLIVNSMTPDTKIYVDGEQVGKTPIDKPIPLPPGNHKLKATKAGYQTLQMDFVIRSGARNTLPVDLIPFSGLVKFSCNVEGAEIYLDNKLAGQIPLVLDVMVGDHDVRILKEGYNDFTAKINVKGGEKNFVQAMLTPFEDLSPEVAAIAKARKDQEEQAKKEASEEAVTPFAIAPAKPWYQDWYKQWWVWAIAGSVVVTAVAVPLAVSGRPESGSERHNGSPHIVIDLGKP